MFFLQNIHTNHKDNFCRSCGTKGETATPSQMPLEYYCQNCGEKLLIDLKDKKEIEVACTKCDNKFVVSHDKIFQVGSFCTCCGTPNKKTEPTGGSGGVWLFIIIGIFVWIFFDKIKDFLN